MGKKHGDPSDHSYDQLGIIQPLHRYSRHMKTFRATPAEKAFWERLKEAYPNKVSRQYVFGWYILDFVVISKHLVVELDGSSHDGREAQDARRTAWIENRGLTVIRFANDVAINTPQVILDAIATHPDKSRSDFARIFRETKSIKKAEQRAALLRKGVHHNCNGRLVPVLHKLKTPSNKPRNPPRKRPRCEGCGRGLAKTWVTCKGCGIVLDHSAIWPKTAE